MSKQLTDKILDYLEEHGEVSSLQLAEVFEENHQKIIGAIKSINAVGDLIDTKDLTDKKWELTQEGQHIVNHGSHEAAVFHFISDEGTTKEEIMLSSPFAKVGFSKALQAGWIELNKNDGKPVVKRKVTSIADTTQKDLKDLVNLSDKAKNDYKKRKLIQEIIIKYVHLAKGPNFSKNIEKLETGLTSDLLVNDAWKKKKFKPYNFEALGAALEVGHLHPLLKVKAEFRKIFLEMGFTEMPTNNYVESSFWNFDALFQPQQHPARDAHDTFFISDPSKTTKFPVDYVEKVKKVHSKGDYGSMGYEYEWKIEEAQKNVLRTHTTAVSARMLYKLMQEGEFKPVKYFSIDRVFRNETLDATHLAEFHQVEGVIADYYLTLGDLIGILYEFFKKLGITQLRFKPAYNPYTEPSMEIFCFHEGLGKWIELGNSGMFRPEMLLPMGFPEDVRVIAWGLSLERPTMIKYGINNVRDLIGPRVDMEMVHNNPICRLDKVSRYIPEKQKHEERKEKSDQEENHSQEIQRRITLGKQSLIVFCDPKYPIKFLKPFLRHVQSYIDISMAYHVHSSVQNLPKNFMEYHSKCEKINKKNGICLTIIWKEIGMDPKMKLPGFEEITGEINIARYLNRLIESCCSNLLRYESGGVSYANEIDNYLDEMHSILHSGMFKGIRKKSRYVMGDEISIVDIILESFDECKSYT